MESTRRLTSSSGNAGLSRIRDDKDDNPNDSVDSSSSTIDKTMTIIIILDTSNDQVLAAFLRYCTTMFVIGSSKSLEDT